LVRALELGRYLAKEVLYRSQRRSGTALIAGPRAPGSKSQRVSALRANAFNGVLYSLLSLFLSLALLAPLPGTSLNTLFSSVMLVACGLCIAFALLSSAGFTATFVSEGMIDLLRTLPITYSTALRAYLAALYLYWGSLSTIALFIPILVAASMRVAQHALSPALLGGGMVTAVSAPLFSSLLGMVLGTTSAALRRSPPLRIVMAATWIAAFSILYIVLAVSRRLVQSLGSALSGAPPWLWAAPIVGPLFSHSIAQVVASLGITSLTIVLLYLAAINRIRALFEGSIPSRPVSVETAVRVVLRKPVRALVIKDIKLLTRDPRRLAGAMLMVVFPTIFSFAMLARSPSMLLAAACFIGSLSGLGMDQLFFVERDGARLLYEIPLTRRELVVSKILALASMTVPASIAVVVGLGLWLHASPTNMVIAPLVCVASALGTASIEAALITRALPREPSAWTELSLRSRVALHTLRLLIALAALFVPISVNIAASMHLIGEAPQLIIVLCYSLALSIAGLYAVARLRGDLSSM